MYETLSTLGIALMVLAPIGIAFGIYLKRNPDIQTFQDLVARLTGVSSRPPEAVLQGQIPDSDKIGLDAPMPDRLQVTQSQQFVTIGGKQYTVTAAGEFAEMTQKIEGTGPFIRKENGLNLKILVLNSQVAIFKLRSREGGSPIWFMSTEVIGTKLTRFFSGPKEGPAGPAKEFRFNGQETPVPFEFPSSEYPQGTWSVVDIGRLQVVDTSGNTEWISQGDSFPFVLVREGKPGSWGNQNAVYLDYRDDLHPRGTGGLFVCSVFDPEQDVQELV